MGRQYTSVGLVTTLFLTMATFGCASTPAPKGRDVQAPPPSIQFDPKGVDFQPWLAEFVAQVRKNWWIPMVALSRHGRTVIGFDVERDGRVLNVRLLTSSGVEGFDKAALWAISASDPTLPLPADYPDPRVSFTVTFHYNMEMK